MSETADPHPAEPLADHPAAPPADRHPAHTYSADPHSADPADDDLAVVDNRLIDRYPAVPAELIRRLRREESNRLAGARITSFLAVLVERATRQRLADPG
ncbi:three-helix bundle dimerization domain-containing protein [Actinosynnema sp. NPDC023587]|uniref:three-helix bundle dimerization domain-containing protein n=1 Tax=Actinosynnema sp. NPDC023587 TaxID=3154695 RepID=UPI00340303DD